jgi:endoglucanase
LPSPLLIAADEVLNALDAPPAFTYLGFKDNGVVTTADGMLHLRSPNGKGGLAFAVDRDLTPHAGRVPVVWVRVNPGNKAKALVLTLAPEDKEAENVNFTIKLPDPGDQLVRLMSDDARSISESYMNGEGQSISLDLTRVKWLHIKGNWQAHPIDVTIDRIELAEPDAAMIAQREKMIRRRQQDAARQQAATEAAAKARLDRLANGAEHPHDGPDVRQVCAVTPETLSLTIQAGTYVPHRLETYTPQPGDEVRPAKAGPEGTYTVIRDGVMSDPDIQDLYRMVDGKRARIGRLSPDGTRISIESDGAGRTLDEETVDDVAAYRIVSLDDPAFAVAVQPSAVFRKSKPNGPNKNPRPFTHLVALRLPSPLREGCTYEVILHALNTRQRSVNYRHASRTARSDAIHAIQTGYRPDDGFKRAYLSTWLGASRDGDPKSGGYTHTAATFELIDATNGKTVFSGKPLLTKAQDALEQLNVRYEKDFTLTAVHALDFSSFATPGTYRVHVPGLGVSDPFVIDAKVWNKPFAIAMEGILTQRQGLELGPPVTDFRRARTFHPDDGVQFYQMDLMQEEGQEGVRGKHLVELAKAGRLQRVEGVWGGYQDAGDWDTLGRHLNATLMLLELYEHAPAAFNSIKLSLPAVEAANALPDLLDEALWQLPCFERLQTPEGGVRGGYGACLHYEGWTSDMIKTVGVYAVDHVTTYRFAASAAMAARLLKPFDTGRASTLLESARRAWLWCEAHNASDNPVFARQMQRKGWPPFAAEHRQSRATAAVALYHASNEQGFHEAFKQSTELADTTPADGAVRYLEQPEATYAYARLPPAMADATLQAAAVSLFRAYADHAIAFSRKNGFEIINGRRTDVPILGPLTFFSTPGAGGVNLVRAYALTRESAHLSAVVQASQATLGVNADNLVYCSGLGHRPTVYPFRLDAKWTGQWPQPVGHIPYGPADETHATSRRTSAWVQQWFLNHQSPKMFPDFYTWPSTEAYIDFAVYPTMNENCFDQTQVIAAYYWGFLATR